MPSSKRRLTATQRRRCIQCCKSRRCREIVDYPVKAYMTRTQVGSRTVDFAAVAREDAPGLVVAYAEREEEDASDHEAGDTLQRLHVCNGRHGHRVGRQNHHCFQQRRNRRAQRKKIEEDSIPRVQWDESGRLHIVDGMTAWSGKRTAFENYSVYACSRILPSTIPATPFSSTAR